MICDLFIVKAIKNALEATGYSDENTQRIISVRERWFCVCYKESWEKSDFWDGFIRFWSFIWWGLQSYERSGLKPQFPWQSIVHRRWLLRRNARGYFRSEGETSVLFSSWKSLKPTCVVISLHCSVVLRSNCPSKEDHLVLLLLWFFFGSLVQSVSQFEACACHLIELTTPFSSAMTFLNDSKLPSLLPNKGFVLVGTVK